MFADPFQSVELPETIEEFLDDGVARCIAFNRRGTLLAGTQHICQTWCHRLDDTTSTAMTWPV